MGADEDLINDSELSVHVDVQKHIVYHVRGNPNPWAETDRHTVEETWERVAAANGGFLGAGGFGQVFKEVCTQDSRGIKVGRYRAVKVIAKSGPWRDPHREGNTKALYKEELKALAKFSYPRYQSWFVMSFGWYEWADSIYITMEYIEHGDLQGYLSERFSEGDTRKIASQVIMGLIYMHEYGFIHRDLKPQNLLVVDKPPEKDWYVKISDFGISKQAVDGEDAFSTVIGTQEYSAPEVYLSKSSTRKASYTRAADMWSLGAICVRLMTGELPFDSRDIYTYYVSNGPFTPDDALRRCNISTAGRDFVQRLMARDASSRLTAMGAMEHNWISHGSQQSQIAPNKPAAPSTQPTRPTTYREPTNGYNATAQWDTGIFDGQEPSNQATVKPLTPARWAPRSTTAIHNPQNEPRTGHASSNNAGDINFSVGHKPPGPQRRNLYLNASALEAPQSIQAITATRDGGTLAAIPHEVPRHFKPPSTLSPPPRRPKPADSGRPAREPKPQRPATNSNATSYEDLERHQLELFHNAGPSKKERKKQRQGHALREFQGSPPSPRPDVVMVIDEPSKGRGADWQEAVEVMGDDDEGDIHAQQAREAKEMERQQRELFLNAGIVNRKNPSRGWVEEARATVDNGADGGSDDDGSDGDSDWSKSSLNSGKDVVMVEPSKPAPALLPWQFPQVHDIKEMEQRQRELFLNAGPGKRKRAKNVKEAERRQREAFLRAGPGKEIKEQRRAGQDLDNIKELERQQRELFLNAGPGRKKAQR